MISFGYLFSFIILGLITAYIFKKLFLWKGTKGFLIYLIIGVIGAVLGGVICDEFVDYAYLIHHDSWTATPVFNVSPEGYSASSYHFMKLGLNPLFAVFSAVFLMIMYLTIFAYKEE